MSRNDMVSTGGKGFDEWMTPPDILSLARQCLGSIDLDPASNGIAQKYVNAGEWCGLDINKNGLDIPWYGNVWLNPPYSKNNIDAFVNKAIFEWKSKSVSSMLILVNSSTDCAWYHSLLNECSAALLWRGRIKFWKIEKGKAWEKWVSTTTGKLTNSPRYLSTLFYFDHRNIESFIYYFANKGTVVCTL